MLERTPYYSNYFQANTRRRPNAGLMLAQRRRRWANISPALAQRIEFTGLLLIKHGKSKLNPQIEEGIVSFIYIRFISKY